MNTTASYSSEPSWSRRCSTETILSIQGKETDFVRDTSDTEWYGSDTDGERDAGLEFEPASEPDSDGPLVGDSSGHSDNEIIATKVVEVSVGDDGSLQLADSEQTESSSDGELDLHDYWLCVNCRSQNNNPLYRYCETCFKVRKNFFPPRPKRKHKLKRNASVTSEGDPLLRTLSQDSGVGSPHNSQELNPEPPTQSSQTDSPTTNVTRLKRRAESLDRNCKRTKTDYYDSDTDSGSDSDRRRGSKSAEVEVKPLVKMVSDPALTVEEPEVQLTKKVIMNSLKEKLETKDDLCIICLTEPKSGVFVHGRIAHICCCYKCAVKVWAKAKRCPVCNCKVSNVLRAVVM